jgi:hypothetical protein
MIAYTTDLHTGTNTWDIEAEGVVSPKLWITCNGERVDMRSMTYRDAHFTSNLGAMTTLALLRNREHTAA